MYENFNCYDVELKKNIFFTCPNEKIVLKNGKNKDYHLIKYLKK